MMKNKVFPVLLAIVLLTAGCGQNVPLQHYDKEKTNDTKSVKQTEPTKEKDFEYISEAGFIVDKTMKPVPVKEWKNIIDEVTLNWVFDPYCPSCTELETAVKDEVKDILKKGIFVKYYALAFLSPKTIEDYSVRASSYILGVVEYAPELAMQYLEKVMDVNQRPISGELRTDEQLKQLFTEIGGTEEQWSEVQASFRKISDIVKRETSNAFNIPERFMDRNPNKKLFVPYLFIGKNNVIEFDEEKDVKGFLTDYINNYLDNLNNVKKLDKAPNQEPIKENK